MKTALLVLALLLAVNVDAGNHLPISVAEWIRANNCADESRRNDIIDEFIAPRYASFAMDGTQLGDRQALKMFLQKSHAAFSSYQLEVLDSAVQGDRTWLRLRASGRNVGPVMGLEPSGVDVSLGLVVILESNNNQVTREWLLSDTSALLRQLKPPTDHR